MIPGFLFLDEATAAMDRKTENFVLSLLQKEKESMAILMVTHRIKTATQSDRIYILEEGTINSSGTPNELMAKKNLLSDSFYEMTDSIQN